MKNRSLTIALMIIVSCGCGSSYIISDQNSNRGSSLRRVSPYRIFQKRTIPVITGKIIPRSPLDEYPRINPHEQPFFQNDYYTRRVPNQFKIGSRIIDLNSLGSLFGKDQSDEQGGGGYAAPAPSPAGPVIPVGLPKIIPVPVPFSVAPFKIVLPTLAQQKPIIESSKPYKPSSTRRRRINY